MTPLNSRSISAKRGWETRRENKAIADKSIAPLEKNTSPDLSAPVMKSWFTDKGMAQIYGSGLEFSFVSKDNEQCHPFAYCKDFLQDAVWAHLNNKTAAIWGFTYTHGVNPPLDVDYVRMGLRFKKNDNFKKLCINSLNFMRKIDKDMNFIPSKLEFGGKYEKTGDEVFVMISDKLWMHSPVMISLYSLFIRVGLTYSEGPWRTHFEEGKSYLGANDKSYIEQAKKALDKIIGKDITKVFASTISKNYPVEVGVSELHNLSGIVTYGKDKVGSSVRKYWGS